MKKEDLIALGIAEDVADKVLALRGKEVTKLQSDLDASKQETETFKTQLADANKQIENFKGMNIDEIKKSADEYKTKFEQAQADAVKQVAELSFNHDLEGAITATKAKNIKAVKALLNVDELKDANGKFIPERFNEQVGKIKPDADYLFEGEKKDPKIVTGGNNQPIQTDAFEAALRKGAGLPETPQGK